MYLRQDEKSFSRCEIKIIDFGSSCYTTDHSSAYIQSRSYRAIEVVLGCPYDNKIDIWSLGCVLAEIFTGYVLFQNDSIESMLARIIAILGPIPEELLSTGKDVPKYFTSNGILYKKINADEGQDDLELEDMRCTAETEEELMKGEINNSFHRCLY